MDRTTATSLFFSFLLLSSFLFQSNFAQFDRAYDDEYKAGVESSPDASPDAIDVDPQLVDQEDDDYYTVISGDYDGEEEEAEEGHNLEDGRAADSGPSYQRVSF